MKMDEKKAYDRVSLLCARSEQCAFDVRRKLITWGLSSSQAARLIDRLRDEQFIDDERYCRAYVRDKFRFNGWGRQKIAFNLRGKQMPSEVIDAALEEIDEEQYREMLMKLLKGKLRSLAQPSQSSQNSQNDEDDAFNPRLQKRREALIRFAASRGYEPDVFFPAVTQVIEQENNP